MEMNNFKSLRTKLLSFFNILIFSSFEYNFVIIVLNIIKSF